MAHFARVEDGVVREVIVVHNSQATDEAAGQAFIASLGLAGDWVQTSYNGNPIQGADRGHYAGVGFIWDGHKFAPPPQPPTPPVAGTDEVPNG